MTDYRSTARISGGTRDISQAIEGMRRAREALAFPGGQKQVDNLTRDFMESCSTRDIMGLWFDAIGMTGWRDYPLQRAIGVAIDVSEDVRRGKRDIGQGVDTFTDILAAHANKALLKGWENAQHTWRRVARVSELKDFKQTTRVGLSEMLLAKVPPSGEITASLRDDRAEYIQGSSYAGTFNVSREALVNDDLGVLVRLPFEAGIAASATVNATFWTYVTSASGVGPTLNQDSLALFHATHANYTATSGTPSVANLEVGRSAMRKQTDPITGRRLNIPPKFLVVPPELETTARILAGSDQLYGDVENLQVVVEAQLTDATNGTTAWYLFADPEQFDTFDVGFIAGSRPYLESQKGWEVDGIRNKVRIAFGVAALDYRGVYRKKGV